MKCRGHLLFLHGPSGVIDSCRKPLPDQSYNPGLFRSALLVLAFIVGRNVGWKNIHTAGLGLWAAVLAADVMVYTEKLETWFTQVLCHSKYAKYWVLLDLLLFLFLTPASTWSYSKSAHHYVMYYYQLASSSNACMQLSLRLCKGSNPSITLVRIWRWNHLLANCSEHSLTISASCSRSQRLIFTQEFKCVQAILALQSMPVICTHTICQQINADSYNPAPRCVFYEQSICNFRQTKQCRKKKMQAYVA